MRYQTAPLPGHPSLRPFSSASDAKIRSHAGGIGIAKVLPLRRAKADWGIRVAAEGQGPARLLLPAVSLSLWQGALPRQPAALHRPGRGGEASAPSRAHA